MGGSWSCLSCGWKLAIPASSTPFSNYGPIVTKSLDGQNSSSSRSIEEQIEHSKRHWSQLSQFELDADEVAEVSNMEVFQALQSHPKWGSFFMTFGKGGIGELVMGQKFAEGGQAELFDVEIHWKYARRNEDLQRRRKWALKVFKKGTSLRQLQLQWPLGMLQDCVDRMESSRHGNLPRLRYCSDVFHGILLADGRFAFLMVKEDEDLRHHIDRHMLTRSKNCCPYSKESVETIMYKVAKGMEWLHSHGIIHRDLKASNVLCTRYENGPRSPIVADYECSIGVIGTGFFRAPEILQACKDYSINDKPELFTKEADVYSYGMVCYEILTGKLPFDDYKLNDYDHVLAGERPKVPEYVDGCIHELLRMCWQSNPVDRPSFEVILKIILANSKQCRKMLAHSKEQEANRALGISIPKVRRLLPGE